MKQAGPKLEEKFAVKTGAHAGARNREQQLHKDRGVATETQEESWGVLRPPSTSSSPWKEYVHGCMETRVHEHSAASVAVWQGVSASVQVLGCMHVCVHT